MKTINDNKLKAIAAQYDEDFATLKAIHDAEENDNNTYSALATFLNTTVQALKEVVPTQTKLIDPNRLAGLPYKDSHGGNVESNFPKAPSKPVTMKGKAKADKAYAEEVAKVYQDGLEFWAASCRIVMHDVEVSVGREVNDWYVINIYYTGEDGKRYKTWAASLDTPTYLNWMFDGLNKRVEEVKPMAEKAASFFDTFDAKSFFVGVVGATTFSIILNLL